MLRHRRRQETDCVDVGRSYYTYNGITALQILPAHCWAITATDGGKLEVFNLQTGSCLLSQTWMDRLRRSFRSSFRRREELQDESGGSVSGRQWPADEAAVKTNSCSFEVKYLGSVEVM